MTIQKSDYFDLASLAEASYAKFDQFGEAKDALTDERFSSISDTQAQSLLADWSLVPNAHQPDTSSDFSSTLFQSTDDDGRYVLAFRGTAGLIGDVVYAGQRALS